MQIFNFLAGPFGLLRVVTNVDEATLQGVEADVRWRANQYMNVFAGFGLLDSEIDSYAGRPYTKGNEVPYAPEYTATAGVDFVVPMGNSGISLIARLDASFTGETWFSAVQDDSVTTEFGVPGDYSKTSRDPFTVLNARLGISAEKWEVTAWARNLTDEEYLAEVIPAPEFGGTFSHEAPGMAIGLDLKYSFGK
jgi:iron complex outermembrane receptor protein